MISKKSDYWAISVGQKNLAGIFFRNRDNRLYMIGKTKSAPVFGHFDVAFDSAQATSKCPKTGAKSSTTLVGVVSEFAELSGVEPTKVVEDFAVCK